MSDATAAPLAYAVRPGTADDLDAVHALVRELAAHLDAQRQVATTPELFGTDFDAGWFDLLVAEEEGSGRILGLMLYYKAYSTWKGRMTYLEDFVVSRAARRRGVGRALWDELVARCRANGSTSIKWQISDSDESAQAFYLAMGAELELNYVNGRLYL